MSRAAVYPFVLCDHHAGRQRAYCVCVHMFEHPRSKLQAGLFNEATDLEMGELCCDRCAARADQLRADELRLICSACLHAEFTWLPPTLD